MEIRYLRLIKAIVEEGSITRAIDKLHLSQSALPEISEKLSRLSVKLML